MNYWKLVNLSGQVMDTFTGDYELTIGEIVLDGGWITTIIAIGDMYAITDNGILIKG